VLNIFVLCVCILHFEANFAFLNIFLFLTLFQSTKYKLLTTANFAKAKFACGGGEIRPVPQLGTGRPEPIMWFGANSR